MMTKNQIELLCFLTLRELSVKYRGSMLGILWAIVNPVLLATVFTLFFSVVFEARWSEQIETTAEHGFLIYTGLLLHLFISEVLTKSPISVAGKPNFVKKIAFPLWLLPLTTTVCALTQLFMGFITLFVFMYFIGQTPSASAFFIIIYIFPLFFMALGIALLFSAIGVYLPDVQQIATVLATVLLFISPVFFSLEKLPEDIQTLALLNPMSYAIENVRAVIFNNGMPELLPLSLYYLASALVALTGLTIFESTRKTFADVL